MLLMLRPGNQIMTLDLSSFKKTFECNNEKFTTQLEKIEKQLSSVISSGPGPQVPTLPSNDVARAQSCEKNLLVSPPNGSTSACSLGSRKRRAAKSSAS